MGKPTFEHRHYVKLAGIIATLPMHEGISRLEIAQAFADKLRGTNPNFNRERFLAAARGEPSNGRDRVR